MPFSVGEFENATPDRLPDYVEPLLAASSPSITAIQCAQLAAHIDYYDEYHLVYAILLCARFDVTNILDKLPGMLARAEAAVFCTGLNILQDLPSRYVSADLLENVESVVIAMRRGSCRFTLVQSVYARLKGSK